MKKRNLKVASLVMACAMAVQGGAPLIAAAARNKSEVQSQKEQLEQELDEVNGKIGDLKSARKDLENTVEKLDGQLNDLTERLGLLDDRISEKKKEIRRVKKQLRKAKAAEADQYESMKKRIRYLYENGDYASVEMLLSSKSIADLLNNAEYITKVAEYDRKMLVKYQETKQEVAAREKKLQKDYDESRKLKREAKSQEAQVQAVISDKQEEIQSFNAQISEKEQLAQEYANEVEAQNEILAQIQAAEEAAAQAEAEVRRRAEEAQAAEAEAQRKAEEAAAAEAAAQAESDAQAQAAAQAEAERLRQEAEAARQEAENQQQAQETESSASSGTSAAAGGFLWPCPSSYTITSDFGGREAPTAGASSNHQGIDIGAPSGSPIVASASGTVVVAEYSVSAGNYVIISHGGGISTVYMHASALYVSPGQSVSAGETIAAVGSTGYSTGAHLHFGVAVNGAYVNPHGYVG